MPGTANGLARPTFNFLDHLEAMAPGGSKTRTSSAHGMNTVKKQYKASGGPNATARQGKPYTQRSAEPAKSSSSTLKRKADDEDGTTTETVQRHIPSSLLNNPDEIDFPRGGGTNLTQVEVREAQLEGLREARDGDIGMDEEGDDDEEKTREARVRCLTVSLRII